MERKDCDKVSIGWCPWLTPRQMRMIRDALVIYEPNKEEQEHYDKLFEWFDEEVVLKEKRYEMEY